MHLYICTEVFIKKFQHSENWFSRAGKTFQRELHYRKNFPPDSHTRWAKSLSQPVDLPGAQLLLIPQGICVVADQLILGVF